MAINECSQLERTYFSPVIASGEPYIIHASSVLAWLAQRTDNVLSDAASRRADCEF